MKQIDHVPLLDLKAQYAYLRDKIEPVIKEVVESQYFIMGPKVKEMEAKLAPYCQCRHALGVSSGTDALLIALMALDIKAGDEVITTPYSFFATAGVVARLGAVPVFVDIDPDTFNIDPAKIAAVISSKTKAIIPVHLFGQMAAMAPIMEIAEKHQLCVIEDAAQAIGSEDDQGRRAGSIGHIGCFSFFPSKNLGAFGDAGMVVTNDDHLADKLNRLRVHGSHPKYYHQIIGGNFRIDALQAAVISIKFAYLDSWTEKRQANASYYNQLFSQAGLDKKLTLPVIRPGYRHIFNQYVIRAPRRNDLLNFLQQHKIGCEIYYPVTFNNQECFAYLNCKSGDFPIAEQAAEQTLALPIYPELSPEQQTYVVAKISEFYANNT